MPSIFIFACTSCDILRIFLLCMQSILLYILHIHNVMVLRLYVYMRVHLLLAFLWRRLNVWLWLLAIALWWIFESYLKKLENFLKKSKFLKNHHSPVNLMHIIQNNKKIASKTSSIFRSTHNYLLYGQSLFSIPQRVLYINSNAVSCFFPFSPFSLSSHHALLFNLSFIPSIASG